MKINITYATILGTSQGLAEDLEDELRTKCEDAYEDRQLEVAEDLGLL